ncbi:MAG: hypothetical protein NTW19_16900 [Planctomycetota bacterium]|nr:hypothetical protein [Planctomycetota bacterium]
MIEHFQITGDKSRFMVGFACGNAHIQIVSNEALLMACHKLFQSWTNKVVDSQLGHFGDHPITLNLHRDGTASIFIDGPDFVRGACQTAAIYLAKEDLQEFFRLTLLRMPDGQGKAD